MYARTYENAGVSVHMRNKRAFLYRCCCCCCGLLSSVIVVNTKTPPPRTCPPTLSPSLPPTHPATYPPFCIVRAPSIYIYTCVRLPLTFRGCPSPPLPSSLLLTNRRTDRTTDDDDDQVEGWHHGRLRTRIVRGREHGGPCCCPQEGPGRPLNGGGGTGRD